MKKTRMLEGTRALAVMFLLAFALVACSSVRPGQAAEHQPTGVIPAHDASSSTTVKQWMTYRVENNLESGLRPAGIHIDKNVTLVFASVGGASVISDEAGRTYNIPPYSELRVPVAWALGNVTFHCTSGCSGNKKFTVFFE